MNGTGDPFCMKTDIVPGFEATYALKNTGVLKICIPVWLLIL